MIAQQRLVIRTMLAALSCGPLIICACTDSVVGPGAHQSGEPRSAEWMGYYANALDTVIVDGTLNTVKAQLELFASPACQLYATFSTGEPDDWAYFHSDNCLYRLERGVVILVLKMRVHYPGGNDLIEGSARFEPVDDSWTAVVWRNIGIRLERDLDHSG